MPKLAPTLKKSLAALISGSGLIGKALATPLQRTTLAERIAALPCTGLPVAGGVTVRWNDHLVPFIEAGSDGDLAFAIGLVTAHLRLGQLGMTKRVAAGRLAECAGPIAAEIDAALRILNFGQAAQANADALPPVTRHWVERYCDGINHYQETVPELPHDVQVLGLGREPFTVLDIMTMGRLVGNDINWLGWSHLLRHRSRPDWPEIWGNAIRYGGNSRASFSETESVEEDALDAILEGVGRNGSNAVAIAGDRTEHGGALLAGDPHVGIFLPALWLIMGIRSRSYHAVGMMIPGVPSLLIGRNHDIAWGATNMRAASSDLVDVQELEPEAVAERIETVRVRWGKDRLVRVRTTEYGPIISDVALFPKDLPPVALRWMGHRVTDEISAIQGVTAARDFDGWRKALADFGVSGMNFLYADRRGHIGQMMAVHLPARDPEPPLDPILAPEECRGWDRTYTGADLPYAYDPPSGFLASANNQPANAPILLGYAFSANDRINRLRELVESQPIWTAAQLAVMQQDVGRLSALRFRDLLLAHADLLAQPQAQAMVARLSGWDGAYHADRFEPVALEWIIAGLAHALGRELGPLAHSEAILDILTDRLAELGPGTTASLLDTVLPKAARQAAKARNWGELHHLKLHHLLANLPVAGKRYPRAQPPVSGSTTTIMKTAHDLVSGPHGVRFGANARHIFDMADPDANWFVVLGGQDGDVGSPHIMDQLPLWLEGRYIRVPLRQETLEREFPHVSRLEPVGTRQTALEPVLA